ncbi:hypothetical protein JXL19_04500 [bacterium]|nr:hypothetical protein [bacterium]
MFLSKKTLRFEIIFLCVLTAIVFITAPFAQAQYWSAIPPYNLLWPLWSPALSPVDSITGLATPLLAELTSSTVLPVQPGLVWDPARQFPWLLYNIPSVLGGGITYFDPFFGLNPWPPSYLTDPLTGFPAPISLPLDYGLLPPTGLNDFGPFVTTGNLYYATQYPAGQFGISLSSLLTAADIWGVPLL